MNESIITYYIYNTNEYERINALFFFISSCSSYRLSAQYSSLAQLPSKGDGWIKFIYGHETSQLMINRMRDKLRVTVTACETNNLTEL